MSNTTSNIGPVRIDRFATLLEHLTSHATITGKVLHLDSSCPLCAQFESENVPRMLGSSFADRIEGLAGVMKK